MNIIELSLKNTAYINYVPLFLYENYIYFIRQNFKLNNVESENVKCDTVHDGFFKYNLSDHSVESIYTTKKIMNYFFNNDYLKLYYVEIQERNTEYFATFFKINNNTQVEKEQFCVKLQSYVENNFANDSNIKISPLDVMGNFDPFVLKEDILGYKVDKINVYDRFYNSLDDKNEFQIFIYDVFEGNSYQVLDDFFGKHGFDNIEVCTIKEKEYIIFNTAMYNELDKYEYVYDPDVKSTSSFRGTMDAIYLIPLETFINEVKQGNRSIPYEKVELIGQEGTVRLIHINDCKIYYKVTYFDKNFSEIVIYDISSKKYQRKRVEGLNNLRELTLDGEMAYFYNNKLKCTIELSGENWENKREIRIAGGFIGVLESKYLISEEIEILNDKLVYYCNVYDINTLKLIKRIEGQPFMLKKHDMVIVC
ncbi:hypothetical protein SH2C18_15140 [Clostridium sediminicola]|uniref:hypothetical protein n=1 Tax=Clostridium sediminicola TaxID=3114879 RepID=UPI0031F21BB4